jgi:D-threo-aldose 1-dehydrogenase
MEALKIPQIIFGTIGLGNLFVALDETSKYNVIRECINQSDGVAVFDTAGKYGAGLALETLGGCLKKLNVKKDEVVISNKLGWLRTELKTAEPTFEPGVWKDLKYDAVQKISYNGILECFEQGNQLLKGYIPQMVSIHDPDEYLGKAKDENQANQLYDDILEAYKALYDLKRQGKVSAIGVGAKDWKTIQKISRDVPLDWVMIANSLTIKTHPKELLDFIHELDNKSIYIINSAVFHSGFLVGGNYYDYKLIEAGTQYNDALLQWRENFCQVCKLFGVKPVEACVQFALNVSGINSVALSTTSAKRVKENMEIVHVRIPVEFWEALRAKGLINADYLGKSESVFKFNTTEEK